MKVMASNEDSTWRALARVGMVVTWGLVASGCEGCSNYFEPENNLEVYEGAEPEEVEFASYCQGVELSRQGAEPFERVDIDLQLFDVDVEGPKLREGLFAVEVIYGEEEGESYKMPVYYDVVEETHFIVSPHHPDSLQGGPVGLRFDDGQTACEGEYDWEVEALPPAPGALIEALESSSELAVELLATYGLTAQEVMSGDLEEIPVMAIPLAIQAWATAHPDNPDSLKRQIEEGRLALSPSAEDLEAVDRIVGKLDFARRNREALNEIAELEAEGVETRFTDPGPSDGLGFGDDLGSRQQGICGSLSRFVEVEINSSDDLSYYMRKAATSEALAESTAMVAQAVGLLSSIPAPSAIVGKLLGIFLTIDQLMKSAHANAYPRELYAPEVRSYAPNFLEDYTQAEEWSDYYISAKAPGWDVTKDIGQQLADLAFSLAGRFDPTPGKGGESVIDTLLDSFGLDDGLAREISTGLLEFVQQLGPMESLGGWLDGSGACVLNPGPWENIRVGMTGSKLKVEYPGKIGSRANGADFREGFCVDGGPGGVLNSYEPQRFGEGAIEVKANGSRAHFPPESNEASSRWIKNIDMLPIEVVMETPNVAALPGETVTLEATIENAHDPSGIWEVVMGEATLENERRNDNQLSVDVVLPDNEVAFPVVVELRSRSSRGLRSPTCDPVPRAATAVIRDDSFLRINPRARCLSEDETHQFEAEYASADPSARPVWSATDGSISQNGLFVPGKAEEVTITARLEGTELTDSVRARVGHCECFYDIRVSGMANGTMGAFMGITGLYADGMLIIEMGYENQPNLHVITAEVPGPFPTVVPAGGGVHLEEIYYGFLQTPAAWFDEEGATLTITRWTPQGYVEGRLRGYSPGGTARYGGENVPYMGGAYIEIDFMAPIRSAESPLGGLFTDCPLRRFED